jgi:hypothetical protein
MFDAGTGTSVVEQTRPYVPKRNVLLSFAAGSTRIRAVLA